MQLTRGRSLARRPSRLVQRSMHGGTPAASRAKMRELAAAPASARAGRAQLIG